MEAQVDNRTHELRHALIYAENIIATLREPFVVFDRSLRVRTANAAFYRDFHVSKEETENRFIYDLGDGQWNIPQLRTLLPRRRFVHSLRASSHAAVRLPVDCRAERVLDITLETPVSSASGDL